MKNIIISACIISCIIACSSSPSTVQIKDCDSLKKDSVVIDTTKTVKHDSISGK